MIIEFLSPYFAFVVILPLVVLLFSQNEHNLAKDNSAIKIPFFDDIKSLPTIKRQGVVNSFNQRENNYFLRFLSFIAWVCLTLSVMRPVSLGEKIPITKEARNLILAIDLSGSMHEMDFVLNNRPIDRLRIAKKLSKEFIKNRKGDRVGAVVFGTDAHLFIPLTFDTDTADELLNELDFSLVNGKTAIGDAIGVSLKSFKDIKSESSVLILLSDGTSNAGVLSNEEATSIAKKMGVKIYTVGIGAKKMAVASLFGRTEYVNPSYDMDEDALKKIATETGGKYFRAMDTKSFEDIYKEIDKIEKIETESTFIQPKKELFYYPLLVAFALFSLIVLLKGKK